VRSPHAPELFVTAPSTTAVARRGADAVMAGEDPAPPEASVVIPCLNEAEALGTCIESAAAAMREHGIDGEIIVADNGSFDESRAIARRMGAVVVDVAARGYGSALMAGIAAARGRYVVMGDADASYDFSEIPTFVAKLRQGFDLVQGGRAAAALCWPGAMPWLHRWWGNPMFSASDHDTIQNRAA